MHVDRAGRHYTAADGRRRDYPTYLLRRSFRDEHGRPRIETLANLSALPEEAIAALRKILKGATLVDAEEVFETEAHWVTAPPIIAAGSRSNTHWPTR